MTDIICIAGALPEEIAPYERDMQLHRTDSLYGFDFLEGELEGHRIVAVECGTGKTNASFACSLLVARYDPRALIFSGVCGSISSSLDVFDTVVSERIAHHDVPSEFITNYRPFLPDMWFLASDALLDAAHRAAKAEKWGERVRFGKMVTGEAFIAEDGRGKIIEGFDPLCVDMESASAAQIAYCANIPYIAVRTVTDTEDDSGLETFRANCVRAAERSYEVVRAMLGEL